MARTPDYVMVEDYVPPAGQEKMVPKGAFIRPVDWYYLPRHIKDANDYSYYLTNRDEYCYCFTRHGLMVVPIKKFRKL